MLFSELRKLVLQLIAHLHLLNQFIDVHVCKFDMCCMLKTYLSEIACTYIPCILTPFPDNCFTYTYTYHSQFVLTGLKLVSTGHKRVAQCSSGPLSKLCFGFDELLLVVFNTPLVLTQHTVLMLIHVHELLVKFYCFLC